MKLIEDAILTGRNFPKTIPLLTRGLYKVSFVRRPLAFQFIISAAAVISASSRTSAPARGILIKDLLQTFVSTYFFCLLLN